MSTTNEARRPLRRSIGGLRLRTVRVQVDEATSERLQELSDRYGVARSTIRHRRHRGRHEGRHRATAPRRTP